MATKKCPYCAEEIQELARKCKHCGEFLGGSHKTELVMAENPTTIKNPYRGKNKQITGMSIFIVSLLLAMASCSSNGGTALFFLLFSLVGLGIYSAGKYEHWYHAE
jgi:uncharacterized membrane protein YvbJ